MWKLLQMQIIYMRKDFEIKNLGKYHVFYLKYDTLLLVMFS